MRFSINNKATRDDIIAMLTEVAEEQGIDFRYITGDDTRCFNHPVSDLASRFPDNVNAITGITEHDSRWGTGCIAGRVYLKMGVPVDRIPMLEAVDDVALAYITQCMDDRARYTLRVAQDQQDGGVTWGEAVSRAATASYHGQYWTGSLYVPDDEETEEEDE